MKKRILLLLLVLCLVGCGRKNNYDDSNDSYIIKSKGTAFIESINSYIYGARMGVNSGRFNMYDSNTLYLIPVGDNKDKSCVLPDSYGKSPYGEWKYLYVGVLMDNYSYNYYVIGEDEKGNGIDFTGSNSLDSNNIYGKSKVKEEGYDVLQKLYNSLSRTESYQETDGSANYNKLSKILKTANKYNKIVVVSSNNCES